MKHKLPKTLSWFHFVSFQHCLRRGVVIILAIAFFSYLGWQVFNVTAAPVVEIITPEDNLVTQEATIEVKGKTEPETKIQINGQDVLADQDGSFFSSIDLKEGLNIIEVVVERRYSKKGVVYRRIILESTTK